MNTPSPLGNGTNPTIRELMQGRIDEQAQKIAELERRLLPQSPTTPGSTTNNVGPSSVIQAAPESWHQDNSGRWTLLDRNSPLHTGLLSNAGTSQWFNHGQDSQGNTRWTFNAADGGSSLFFDRPNNRIYYSFGLAQQLQLFQAPMVHQFSFSSAPPPQCHAA